MKAIYIDLEKERKKKVQRFWRPMVFYLFGPGGSGKSGLVQELFKDEFYDKHQKQRSGSNWWNEYDGQEIVFLDEFYTKIEWNNMVNLLNDTSCSVEIKHGGFAPFLAKYIFMTTTKNPLEAYNFNNRGGNEDDNKRDFRQFGRRLDFVIKFGGVWHDVISERITTIIFHQCELEGINWGTEEQFRSMNWDIKYRNSCNTPAKVIEKSKILNKDIEGEHVMIGHMVYWRRKFPEYKRRYLQDYPRSRELFEYRMECESQSQQIIPQNSTENTDPQIESSTSQKRKSVEIQTQGIKCSIPRNKELTDSRNVRVSEDDEYLTEEETEEVVFSGEVLNKVKEI
ncbi:15412_t:CDS:2 [Dentiscutata heterogama]|uniref:15412_t:CDS:1 n=1 Tax=Dentiscutata heterogama TaxID=1316150 RepID=A0ACA9KYG9_9GLOM|nr:15412_t:CDS:2 [Dentiscutata heterogama]